ncbi:MAG: AsmA-like C-terminal region-containing protein [Ignavibacteriaceae bacterium]|nr:AsmA-like C-terminal region-containing protein [Ignavibacteriaceae bacterium]
MNQKINGKVSFSDISFTPFKHFPNAALKFYDLSLQESKDSVLNLNKPPVFDIGEAYISVNIIDLFSSKFNVSNITFETGSLNIVVYPDSQTNLEKSLKIESGTQIIVQDKFIVRDTLGSQTQQVTKSTLNLQIDKLEIIDVKLIINNYLTKNKLQLQINELQSGFTYINNRIVSSLNFDTKVDSLIIRDNLLLTDEQLNFESNIEVITDSIFVKLEKGSLSVGAAKLNVYGTFDSKNEGYIDLFISIADKDFSLFSLVLRDKEIKNLKAGDFFFQGSVKGKTLVEFPQTEISFGLIDVELINPVTQRKIKNLNLKGYFNSGKIDDFSKARLKIDTLYADFPNGALKLSGSVNNFSAPEFDTQFFLNADVIGLDKVFKLDFMDNLKGKIEINDRLKGKYIKNEKRFDSEINNANIFFEDFGFAIPGTIKIDRLNGNISRKNDDYYFDNLSVISDDTDFLINGKIENLQYLIFNIEKEINADLTIKSSVFDLPNFLAFDPSIKRDFNYRILDVDVDVLAKTTTFKATNFKSFPQIDFDIRKLYATAENFLPPLKINSGSFKVSESILGFNLKCDNFKTAFLDGDFNLTAEYNISEFQPFYIKAKTSFDNIYLSKLFYSPKDTVPESMKGKLSGSFFAELQFPVDSTILKFVNLKDANLLYQFSGDTITTKSLSLSLSDVYFNDAVDSNPFATLSTVGKLKAAELHASELNLDNITIDFKVNNGTYKLSSNRVRFFGEHAKGKAYVVLSPFSNDPSYHINYTVDKFYAEEMLETFLLDTMVTGPLSLSMDVNSKGFDWDNVVKNMKGSINLSGKDLIFYGMDADKLIEKFKRSQSFNLVDLGAVLLAGPVGIAVTKGSDYASILITNSGESSQITNMVSNWKIANGVLNIQDAAFATRMNRIATKGLIDFSQDSLNLTIALLNKYGCSVFSQDIYGNLNSPTMGKLKVVSTILSPITNLVDDILGIDCDVFYDGTVKHPK